MGTAVRPASTTPAAWDAFTDVDAFVDEVLTELAAMAADGRRPTRPGPKPPLTGAALRKAIMAVWCVCYCGMQWRAIGQLSGIPFGTLFALFARWTRLGLWRRLLDRLRRTWCVACGDTPEPSTVVIDSRTCRSAPSCFARGVDGGKKIRGVKVHIAVEKYGLPLAVDASPANVHDTKGIVPVLRQLVGKGFQGPAIGDLGYRGERLAKVGEDLGITIQPIARGRDGVFIPTEIAWVVERSFAWAARYRRLNIIVERTKEHLVAFVEIAFVSILARRLKRLTAHAVSA
ncbi:IS5 family transposase [Azospirillum canadense]|uniref:IS5 family transposase n=1 Tax=Azospirillum canadense TaxID=403962 RepID=UPI002225EDEC|nr:IS5 family transposase [Azospirillum canadense]MCW2240622.1 transposase [Azospirillum canadense]